MCFGGDNTASDIAQQQRQDETARQARIASGMSDIDRIFSGSSAGTGVATSYDPSKTYYNADGSVYKAAGPNTTGALGAYGGTPGGLQFANLFGVPGYSAATSPEDLIKAGKLYTGVSNTGGFDDAFYAKQGQGYEDYALPQIDHQYGLAKDQEVYALARSGLLDSTAGQNENSELSRTNDQARIDVGNQAQNYENQSRSNVEQVRSNLVSELNATGDDQAAAAAATRQAQNLYQPVGYSPLGDAFATFTSGLSNIGANAGNNYAGLLGRGGGAGLPALFGGASRGSSSIVSGAS